MRAWMLFASVGVRVAAARPASEFAQVIEITG